MYIVNLCKFKEMTSKIVYEGNLRTIAQHLASGNRLETDAPLDNMGKGERFSPTDLVATALGSCMMTIMGIAAKEKNISLDGTEINIQKEMAINPRRIIGIMVEINFPRGLNIIKEDKIYLEKVAKACPVAKSIHPDIAQNIQFNWS